ncbi:MAG: YtxH domain-containing protein [Ignavibacteria bacterium]|nr:YtxH domain-containing protein [Ignavibacteria bacterium]
MYREEKITGSFITGLVTGSLIGGVAALLFAPKSGKELRKDISVKGTELYDDANHLLIKHRKYLHLL